MSVRCFMVEDYAHSQQPGSMWWEEGVAGKRWLHVRTPDGHAVNLTDAGERAWTLSGDPPNVTLTGSLLNLDEAGRQTWHGWLRNGELVDA